MIPKQMLMLANSMSSCNQSNNSDTNKDEQHNSQQVDSINHCNQNGITIIASTSINTIIKANRVDSMYPGYENIHQLTAIKSDPSSPSGDFQSDNSQFYADYIDLSLEAGLSFTKLTSSPVRTFFLKHFGVSIPTVDKMTLHVLRPLQEEKMDKLKKLVADQNIYIILKTHWDPVKGHILTIMVGILNGHPSRSYLYKMKVFKELDLTILSREMLGTLNNLYQGLVFEKLSFLVTDDSPLMKQIGTFLKTLNPQLRHIPCLYQAIDTIAELFRQSHPLMRLFVETLNGFFIESPTFREKYKRVTTKKREVPVPASKLYGFNWFSVADDFFAEATTISEIISAELNESTKENYLTQVHEQLENKELHMEWIDYNGFQCLQTMIRYLKLSSSNITQMKEEIYKLGRLPKRSFILTRINDLIKSNPDFAELMTFAEDLKDEQKAINCRIFKYAPLSTLDSIECYDTFINILEENDGSLGDMELEILTFLACNKDL